MLCFSILLVWREQQQLPQTRCDDFHLPAKKHREIGKKKKGNCHTSACCFLSYSKNERRQERIEEER